MSRQLCLPSCQYLIGSNQCAAYTSCDDTSGTAICSCTIYVDSNNNAATAKGGALYTNNSTVEIKDSLFKNNSVQCSADTYGGAISSNNSRLTIIDSGFLSNTATDYCSSDNIFGGAIYSDNQKESSLTISNSSFNNNQISATDGELSGGAIYNATDKAKFDRLTILNNSNIVFNGVTKSLGAGIYNSGKGVTGTNLFINMTHHFFPRTNWSVNLFLLIIYFCSRL